MAKIFVDHRRKILQGVLEEPELDQDVRVYKSRMLSLATLLVTYKLILISENDVINIGENDA